MPDIERFIKAQELTHEEAVRELKDGYKQSHWSWWEIPQIVGLGMTGISQKYAIRDLEEAEEYLENDTLRTHLFEICDALLSLETNDAGYVMGYPDDLKLRSCMTLFLQANPICERFQKVLDKFFGGKMDEMTLEILKGQE